MVHSPSKKWEDGVLAERAISTNEPGDPVEDDEFVSGTKKYKTPTPTLSEINRKRVASAENKAVAPEKASKKASKK